MLKGYRLLLTSTDFYSLFKFGVALGFVLLAQAAFAYDEHDFFPPSQGGGYMFIDTRNGYGEPLNVIISARSSSEVLTDLGLVNWARSIGMSYECMDVHGDGGWFSADLGDGNGFVRQQLELRQMYSSAEIGSCLETFVGGNHFRSFKQNGPDARTNAVFLAVSHEENLSTHHHISPNGYDMGRDEVVFRATNQTTYFGGVTYQATSEDIVGLLDPGSEFVNHNIAIDGVVTMLTIRIIEVDEDGKDWLDTIMEEVGLSPEPGHRESRLIFDVPDPEIAPNEDEKPESGPENLISDWFVENSSTMLTTTTRFVSATSSSTTSSSGPTYTKQGDAKILGVSGRL